MRKLLKQLLSFLTSASLVAVFTDGYALSLHSKVDYWNDDNSSISSKTKKQNIPKKRLIIQDKVEEAINVLSNAKDLNQKKYKKYIEIVANNIDKIPDDVLENLPINVVLAISKYQKEQQIKKKKALVDYLYLKNPTKFRDAYWDWYTWQTTKSGQLTDNLIAVARENGKMVFKQKALEDWAKNNGLRLLFFCNDESKYCRLTMPTIEKIAKDGIKVYYINTDKHQDAVRRWHVQGIPTTIAVIPDKSVAVKYVGAFSNVEPLLYYFYITLSQRNNPLLKEYVQ